jgi:hypothetical protein
VMMPYRKSVLNEVSVTETVVSRSQEKYTGLVLGMTDLHPTYPAYENPLSRHVSTSSTSKFDGGNAQWTADYIRGAEVRKPICWRHRNCAGCVCSCGRGCVIPWARFAGHVARVALGHEGGAAWIAFRR